MKSDHRSKVILLLMALLLLTPISSVAQCEIFKSELDDVIHYEMEVSQLTDSLQPFAESAAYAARLDKARTRCT